MIFRSLALPLFCLLVITSASAWAAASRSSGAGKSLSAAAADPTEPLVQLTTDHDVAISNRGGNGAANQFLIQPVFPLPAFERFPTCSSA